MRPHGIDISHWQSSYTPQPSPPKPVDFVITKFSEGYAESSKVDELWQGAREANSAEGYHYWRTAASLQQQYDSFMRSADGKDVDAAWLDWEGHNNSLTKSQYEMAYEWIEMMECNFPKVGFYTNRALYQQMNAWGTWHHDKPFWYANYWVPCPDPYTNNPTLPKKCETWDTWQYGICQMYGNTENGRDYGVVSQTLDLNIRNEEIVPPVVPPSNCETLKADMVEIYEIASRWI